MSKLKIIEVVVLAGTALFAAAKSVIKFIDYIIKLSHSRKNVAASAA